MEAQEELSAVRRRTSVTHECVATRTQTLMGSINQV